jgi:uncharacterized protein (TIRG00374 family)
MMSHLKTIFKAVISLGLLGYLIYLADPKQVLNVLDQVWYENGIIYLSIAAVLFLLSLVVLSFRWQILVRGYGLNISTWLLFKYYLIGLFFNNFLPTSIGGDVLRVYNLIRSSGNRTVSFASVMTERLLGISSTLILALISIILMRDEFRTNLVLYLVLGMISLVVLFFAVAFSKKLVTPIENITLKLTIFRLGERIQKFLDAIRFYSDSKLIYVKILLVSLLGQILIIIKAYCLGLALGIDVNPIYMFLVVPIAIILSMLPSINGIGFRDGGYVILLAKVGVSKAAALSLSFLTLLIPILISISGGILFMLQKKVIREEGVKIVEKSIT